jgi:hypothetical protein
VCTGGPTFAEYGELDGATGVPKSVDAREQSKMNSGRLKPGAGCAGYRSKRSGKRKRLEGT